MRIAHLALTASLTCAAPAVAQPIELPKGLVNFAEIFTQVVLRTAVSAVRSQVELTYEDIVLDLAAGRMAITGLDVRPALPWDQSGDCVAFAEAIEVFAPANLDISKGRIEIIGLDLPLACLPLEPQQMVLAAGYERIRAPSLSIDFNYQTGSSALDLTVAGTVEDAVAFEAAMEFAYFWVQTPVALMDDALGPNGGGAPEGEPVADLAFAEIVVSDEGLLERAGPMLGAMIGGFEAAPPMIEGAILQQLGADGQVFAGEARAMVEAFLAGEGDIVLTIAPDQPVWLSPDLFADPGTLFAALAPAASGRPAATTALIDRSLLEAALAGEAISDADRLTVGHALATGVGAPRAPEIARQALAPLISAQDPEAALIASESYGSEDVEAAYGLALIAAAGGAEGALTRLNRLEASLTFEAMAAAQQGVSDDLQGAAERVLAEALASGDLSEIRARAILFDHGVGAPRNYLHAYRAAILAAAGGDRTAAALRDRIDARMSRRGAGSDGWARARDDVARSAMREWLEGGLLDALAQ